MSKKDYELLAEAIWNIRSNKNFGMLDPVTADTSIRKICAAALANALLKDNKKFDVIKWYDACGV